MPIHYKDEEVMTVKDCKEIHEKLNTQTWTVVMWIVPIFLTIFLGVSSFIWAQASAYNTSAIENYNSNREKISSLDVRLSVVENKIDIISTKQDRNYEMQQQILKKLDTAFPGKP